MEEDEWIEGGSLTKPKLVDCSDQRVLQQLQQTDEDILLYDPAEDIRDECWAVQRFGNPKNCVLSCPLCFTACAYEAFPRNSQFMAKKGVNVDLPQLSEGTLEPEVVCSVCKTVLGIYSIFTKEYTFNNVLTGSG